MILDASTVDRDVELDADACVVGSGCGGAVAARELAAGGMSVVVLEEGRYWTSRDFTQVEEQMYPRLYRERGTKPTADYAVLVSQGRALGGSSIVSFCLCFRTPHQILTHWRERFGLGDLSYETLYPHLEKVENAVGVRQMGVEQLNANNHVLLRGSERLGYRGRFLRHNRSDCLGCGYCAIGCAYDRKGDMLTSYLTPASRSGARILPEVRVESVITDAADRSRVRGAVGRLRQNARGRSYAVRVNAPIVVLAAGALQSPALWLRSGLPDPHAVVGKNLHLHPYLIVAGLFEERIAAWQGVPQSYVVDEFLKLDKTVEGGYLLLSAGGQPVASASLLPGLGAAHRRLMGMYAHTAAIASFLHDRSAGHVRTDERGQIVIEYRLNEADKQDVMEALRQSAEILFAAGATSVVLPYNDLVELRRPGEQRIIEERGIVANDPLFVSFHPQGTLRMGADATTSVVTSKGAAHLVKGLYVADASIFPTSVAVPPQVSVMAFAARTAEHILSEHGRAAAG